MAAGGSIRSWLKGRGRDKKTPDEPAVLPAADKEPQRREFRLDVPPEHPLMELWRMSGQNHPRPELIMRLPESGQDAEEDYLPDAENFAGELSRMEGLLRNCAAEIVEAAGDGTGPVPDRDARINLFVTTRRLTAWVYVFPPLGRGAELTGEALASALESANLCFGLNTQMIDTLPRAGNRYLRFFLAAVGDPPLDGKDGYVIDMFSRKPASQIDADGGVDFDSVELFQKAKKGDVICRLVQPTACRDGTTVQNRICYARLGKHVPLPAGRNTEVSEDGTQLLAGCEGHVEFSGQHFQVKSVMSVTGNVDATTGDISCLGDVRIHGDVCRGYNVRATGSVIVDGVVESSSVEAGGDIIVRKGVVGNNLAVLRSHRRVFARFLENSNVYAKETLEAECVIGCHVYSDGSVTVRSGRGAVIGGSIRAARLVSANIVGVRTEQQTHIILGGRPFESFERDLLVNRIKELESELCKLAGRRDGEENDQAEAKMRMQLSASRLRLRKYDSALGDEPAGTDAGRLKAGTIYPGTVITAKDISLSIRERTVNCTAYLDGGEIRLHF